MPRKSESRVEFESRMEQPSAHFASFRPCCVTLSAKSEMGCIQSSAMTPEDLAAMTKNAKVARTEWDTIRTCNTSRLVHSFILTRNSASARVSNAFIATGFAAACI